jgi:hypothetical protein
MKYIIDLNKGVLPFYIGRSIDEYKSQYSFNFIEGEVDESWNEYDFFDDTIEIYINKVSNKIDSIACRDNCYLDEVNLIGLNVEDFFTQFKIDKSQCKIEKVFLTDEEENVYDIDDIGLQLWVNSSNKIVTVFVTD